MSKEIVTQYYEHLTNKDVDSLKSLLSDTVAIKSATLTTDGKTSVGDGFTAVFESATSIQLVSTVLYQDGNTIIAEIGLNIDGALLDICDVITVENELITAIHSYNI